MGSHIALSVRYIAESMPVFALRHVTQRASLLVTALLVFGVEACGSDTNGALFGNSENGPKHGTGGSASATGGSQDTSGGSANGDSGSTSHGGTTSGSGGVNPGTGGGPPSSGGAASGGAMGSSGGTTAAGGSTGGKAQPGGSGGGAPDAGSGGSEIDSGSGMGGAPPDSGGGTGGSTVGDGKIRCGETTCDKGAGELCCIKDSSGRSTATCATNAQGCGRAFRCDSDSDCSRGEHCCMDFPNAVNTPSTSCAKECSSPLSCSVPGDCADGQSCCGVVIQGPAAGVRYESVACQQKCGDDTVFCTSNSQCSNNTSCQQSQTLPPGYTVCR